MKKLLVFAVMFGIFVGMMGFAFAAEQGVEVEVGEDIHLLITPETVDFGTVVPGPDNPATTNGGLIEFDADGSNVDVTVTVDDVTGFPFAGATLFLDGDDPIGKSWFLECVPEDDICTYVVRSTVPTLDVPVGTSQGTYLGAITYLVTGSPPSP